MVELCWEKYARMSTSVILTWVPKTLVFCNLSYFEPQMSLIWTQPEASCSSVCTCLLFSPSLPHCPERPRGRSGSHPSDWQQQQTDNRWEEGRWFQKTGIGGLRGEGWIKVLCFVLLKDFTCFLKWFGTRKFLWVKSQQRMPWLMSQVAG